MRNFGPAVSARMPPRSRRSSGSTNCTGRSCGRRAADASTARRLLSRLTSRGAVAKPPRGVYLWGGVGRGKTWLMDLFFQSLPFEQKRRSHFHRFMHDVHADLRQHRDTPDPLALVAARIAGRARVLCFDELFVADIADAMLLGGLFKHLFEHRVALVITSNVRPKDLYREGLQRQRFLPAIALLEQHLDFLNVDGGTDYRLRQLTEAPIYVVGEARMLTLASPPFTRIFPTETPTATVS